MREGEKRGDDERSNQVLTLTGELFPPSNLLKAEKRNLFFFFFCCPQKKFLNNAMHATHHGLVCG